MQAVKFVVGWFDLCVVCAARELFGTMRICRCDVSSSPSLPAYLCGSRVSDRVRSREREEKTLGHRSISEEVSVGSVFLSGVW